VRIETDETEKGTMKLALARDPQLLTFYEDETLRCLEGTLLDIQSALHEILTCAQVPASGLRSLMDEIRHVIADIETRLYIERIEEYVGDE